jgi:hypothetical protein
MTERVRDSLLRVTTVLFIGLLILLVAGTFVDAVPATVVLLLVVRFNRCSCKRLTQSKSPSFMRLFSSRAL